MKKCLVVFWLTVLHSVAFAQSQDLFGFLPSVNLNKKLPKDWSLNFKSEFRQNLYQEDFIHEYVRTDLAFLIGKKIGLYTSAAGGYQRIIESGTFRNRYIQQLNFITPTRAVTLGHRVSSDQTFGADAVTEVRLRYRLSGEIPLNGASLDKKEFFVKASNEWVNDFQANNYDLEIRWLIFLGYKLTSKTKCEIGVDYRVDRFVHENLRNRAWLSVNFFQSF